MNKRQKNLLKERIEDLRLDLNKRYNNKATSLQDLMELSRQLDDLIVDYLKLQQNDND